MRAVPSSVFVSEPNADHARILSSPVEMHVKVDVGFNACMRLHSVISCLCLPPASVFTSHDVGSTNATNDTTAHRRNSLPYILVSLSSSTPSFLFIRESLLRCTCLYPLLCGDLLLWTAASTSSFHHMVTIAKHGRTRLEGSCTLRTCTTMSCLIISSRNRS